MLNQFKWYRRLRGGAWARVTGFLFGKRWIKLPKEAGVWQAEEVYGGGPDNGGPG